MFGAARPRRGRRHHPQRRVQRALRGAAPGDAAPRPPLRVDPRPSSAPGPTRVAADATATRSQLRGIGELDDPESARPPSWPSSPEEARDETDDRELHRPRAEPGRPGRRHRLGQVDLRPRRTSGRPRWSPPTSAAASSPTTRTTSPPRRTRSTCCTTSPAQRLRRGLLTVVDATNVQPEAARARWSSWPASTTCCRSRSCSTCRKRSALERNADRADRDFGAHVVRRQHRDLRRGAARAWRRRVPHASTCCAAPTRSTPPTIVRDQLFNDLRASCTGPFDVIGDVHGCRAELEHLLDRARLRDRPRRRRPAVGARTPTAAAPSSSATWSTGARTPRACCAWSWAWSRPAPRSAWPATTRTSCSGRCAAERQASRHGLAESLAQLDAETEEFRAQALDVHRRPDQPLRAGRRPARGRARRAEGGATTAAPPGRVRAFACTATPPARPTSTACRCATRGRRSTAAAPMVRLRPHPGAQAGVGEQHPVPRHRLRLRRPAHRAALPRAGAVSVPAARVVRTGQAARARAARRPRERDGPRHRRRRRAPAWSRPPTPAGSGSARRTPPPRWR